MSTIDEPASSPRSLLRIEDLLVPSAFPHPVSGLRLVETHISWIVLTGSLAYKIKKPVKLDFIDTSTLERRLFYCKEELRLNRRLAPELYLDIVPITCQADRAHVGGGGPAIEYAVCMKQFPAEVELSALLERREVSLEEILRLGETLARFHQQTPELSGLQPEESMQQLYETVLDNLEQLLEYTGRHQEVPELRRLWDWTRTEIDTHEAAFAERASGHRIRDGHGDLHAANIVRWDGRLVPFDCIDFDPQLRCIDVMNDLAFLIMDLHSYERADLAAALLTRYLEITGDYEGVRLLPFYAVYRALVRAKVDAIATEQSPHLVEQYTNRMLRRVRTALALTRRGRPVLLLMHGISGSGKSWLSEQLVASLPALRIRSDLERRRLLGTSSATGSFKQGNYAPEKSHRVYARLIECAESCLQAGFNVIVDAAFLDVTDRELFTSLADRMNLACAFISCQADPATLRDRVASRAERGNDASEADQSILQAQLDHFQPLATGRHRIIQVDTRTADALTHTINSVRSLQAYV